MAGSIRCHGRPTSRRELRCRKAYLQPPPRHWPRAIDRDEGDGRTARCRNHRAPGPSSGTRCDCRRDTRDSVEPRKDRDEARQRHSLPAYRSIDVVDSDIASIRNTAEAHAAARSGDAWIGQRTCTLVAPRRMSMAMSPASREGGGAFTATKAGVSASCVSILLSGNLGQ